MTVTGPPPRIVRLAPPEAGEAAAPPSLAVVETPDPFAEKETPERLETPSRPRRGSLWLGLFGSSLGALVMAGVGIALWRLVGDLAAAHPVLGWVGVALVGLLVLAALALVIGEGLALRRMRRLDDLRAAAARAAAADDGPAARAIVQRLSEALADGPATPRLRAELAAQADDIIDGRDRLVLAERLLLAGADREATRAVAAAAQRVSVVTAISPRALVDILFVLAQSVLLIRRVAEAYGARPGTLGFLRLGRRILGHLAVTGGLAISDSVLSQVLGHGLAARLSAKLGEGVLNGLLTARVGLAAIAACRPLPFLGLPEPKLQDVAGALLPGGEASRGPANPAG